MSSDSFFLTHRVHISISDVIYLFHPRSKDHKKIFLLDSCLQKNVEVWKWMLLEISCLQMIFHLWDRRPTPISFRSAFSSLIQGCRHNEKEGWGKQEIIHVGKCKQPRLDFFYQTSSHIMSCILNIPLYSCREWWWKRWKEGNRLLCILLFYDVWDDKSFLLLYYTRSII